MTNTEHGTYYVLKISSLIYLSTSWKRYILNSQPLLVKFKSSNLLKLPILEMNGSILGFFGTNAIIYSWYLPSLVFI